MRRISADLGLHGLTILCAFAALMVSLFSGSDSSAITVSGRCRALEEEIAALRLEIDGLRDAIPGEGKELRIKALTAERLELLRPNGIRFLSAGQIDDDVGSSGNIGPEFGLLLHADHEAPPRYEVSISDEESIVYQVFRGEQSEGGVAIMSVYPSGSVQDSLVDQSGKSFLQIVRSMSPGSAVRLVLTNGLDDRQAIEVKP